MEAVTNDGGSIVIASERNPFELGLPERLESRLAAGIVTRVDPFEREERRAFIEAMARRHRRALPGMGHRPNRRRPRELGANSSAT